MKNTQILRDLFYENPQLETLQKLLIVDSQGQHKDNKSAERLAIEKVAKKQLQKEQKTINAEWKNTQEEYLKEKVQLSKYFLATLQEDNQKLVLANKIISILMRTYPKTGEMNVNKVLDLNALRSDFNSDVFDKGMDLLLEARYNKLTSCYVSGRKNIMEEGRLKTLKFRFSV